MKAKEVMSSPVLTVRMNHSLKDIAMKLVDCEINGAPVVDDDGRMVGFIAEDDLLPVQSIADPTAQISAPLDLDDVPRTAGDIMNRDVIAAPEDAPVALLARMMLEYGIMQIPVVSSSGEVVGIVARRDILRVLARPDFAINADVQRKLDAEASVIGSYQASVADGRVTLHPEREGTHQELAIVLARDVPGVVDVRLADLEHAPVDIQY